MQTFVPPQWETPSLLRPMFSHVCYVLLIPVSVIHSLFVLLGAYLLFFLPDMNVNLWLQAGSSCTLALFWCQSGSKSYTEDEWKPKHCHNILTSCKVNYHKFDSHIRFPFQQKENQITFKIQDSWSFLRPLGNLAAVFVATKLFFVLKITLFSFKKIMILPPSLSFASRHTPVLCKKQTKWPYPVLWNQISQNNHVQYIILRF